MAGSGVDEQQEYERRLKRRLEILKKEIEAGKVKINSGLGVIESLKAERVAPESEGRGGEHASDADGKERQDLCPHAEGKIPNRCPKHLSHPLEPPGRIFRPGI